MKLYNFIFLFCLLNIGCATKSHGPVKFSIETPCPDSPNCVSSLYKDQDSFIEPLGFKESPKIAWQKLVDTLKNTKGVQIIDSSDSKIHATFTSTIFRFVDDVYFRLDGENKIIDLRSSSRVGYYDFGANRKRIENLRKQFSSMA